MSTKLDTLLRTSHEEFETAKEIFLDDLANFLTVNRVSVIRGDHFFFSIRITFSGTDMLERPRYRISFAPLPYGISLLEAHKEPHALIYTPFTPAAITKFLQKEYNAEISSVPDDDTSTYLKITLPFS